MGKKFSLTLAAVVWFRLIGYGADQSAIPFRVSRQQFEPGDSIVIQKVIASSPQLKVGTTITVRGMYRLQSKAKGSLGFFITTKGPSEPTPISPTQQVI